MKIATPVVEDPRERADFVDEGFDYFINAFGPGVQDSWYHCPCCRYPALRTRGSFEVCPVCNWEDDGQDSHDADRVRGGPNGSLSLSDAQAKFAALGASDESGLARVRPPSAEERKWRDHDG